MYFGSANSQTQLSQQHCTFKMTLLLEMQPTTEQVPRTKTVKSSPPLKSKRCFGSLIVYLAHMSYKLPIYI